ncbi:MAG: hypothetical protein QOD72_1953 [Acidimicrobiaceae bacterium]|jgi:hypothetical protein|nr:hypothetical protein [Acidimicrobiaceae bacterium]
MEGPNNDNKYGRALGSNNIAWCGMFVSWCLQQAGFTVDQNGGPNTEPNPALTASGAQCYQRLGRWSTSGPQPGDLVFFSWHGDHVEHVGLVESVAPSAITTIEGNAGDDRGGPTQGVFRHQRPLGPKVVGFGRPVYAGGNVETASTPTPATTPVAPAVSAWPAYPGEVGFGDGAGDKVAQHGKVQAWQEILIQAGVIADNPSNHDGQYLKGMRDKVFDLQSRVWGWSDADGRAGPHTYAKITGDWPS